MNKKIWIGNYKYSFEEGALSFEFEIEAEYSNGSFVGSVHEEEFSGTTSDRVAIKGFIESDWISFVKTYPYLYAASEDGGILIDKGQRGHEVVYEGHFDETDGFWRGEWEVLYSEEKVRSGLYKYETIVGPWEMRLKDEL